MLASFEGREEVASLLLRHGANSNRLSDNASQLLSATQNGHAGMVRLLLQNGADVNTGATGDTALSFPLLSVATGRLQPLLLEAGVSVNRAKDCDGTPLVMAAQGGHLGVVLELLRHGAAVDKSMKDGTGPLYLAAENCHV
jgi:ankyrin repeat protein